MHALLMGDAFDNDAPLPVSYMSCVVRMYVCCNHCIVVCRELRQEQATELLPLKRSCSGTNNPQSVQEALDWDIEILTVDDSHESIPTEHRREQATDHESYFTIVGYMLEGQPVLVRTTTKLCKQARSRVPTREGGDIRPPQPTPSVVIPLQIA